MSRNLLERIITSIILLSLLFLVNFSHEYIFIISILTLAVIVCFEANSLFLKLIENRLLKENTFFKKFNFSFLLLNLITFCYIFFIFCYFSYEIHKLEGPVFFLYVVCVCFFTDIGGYIFGKVIGGKKLSKISPNKTISGTIGSFIFSIIPLIVFIIFGYLDLRFNLNNIIFCVLVSLISQLGDLLISLFKRKAQIKDTGNLLPGHGGVLDRVDGIIFALPFSYLLLNLVK